MNHHDTSGFEINADLGEHDDGGATDALLMPWIQRANIACGGHAGNEATMRLALLAAKEHGVLVGAHPSYPDRAGFGRRATDLPRGQILDSVHDQIMALRTLAIEHDMPLDHVKPHGALYNDAARDADLAASVIDVIRRIDPGLAVLGLADGAMETAAHNAGLRFIREAFIDRAYEADGHLRARGLPGAVLDLAGAQHQAIQLRSGTVTCHDGSRRTLRADTYCVHGDGAEAARLLALLASPVQAAD